MTYSNHSGSNEERGFHFLLCKMCILQSIERNLKFLFKHFFRTKYIPLHWYICIYNPVSIFSFFFLVCKTIYLFIGIIGKTNTNLRLA